jgi:hypothetical protein
MHLQNRYEDATERLLQAQQQFIHVGDKLDVAQQCLQSLGDIMCMQNIYEDATQRLLEAQQQFIQIGNEIGAAQCIAKSGKHHVGMSTITIYIWFTAAIIQ